MNILIFYLLFSFLFYFLEQLFPLPVLSGNRFWLRARSLTTFYPGGVLSERARSHNLLPLKIGDRNHFSNIINLKYKVQPSIWALLGVFRTLGSNPILFLKLPKRLIFSNNLTWWRKYDTRFKFSGSQKYIGMVVWCSGHAIFLWARIIRKFKSV